MNIFLLIGNWASAVFHPFVSRKLTALPKETKRVDYSKLTLSFEDTFDGVTGKPAYGWSGNIKNNPEGTLPVDFVVDYVRVYQYKDKP